LGGGGVLKNHNFIFEHHMRKQNGICPICGKDFYQEYNPPTIQHRLSNSKHNRELYPLFIDSTLNTVIIHLNENTTTHRSYGRISEYRADKIEKRLRKYPSLAKRVNGEGL
jgi:hypothetical protein